MTRKNDFFRTICKVSRTFGTTADMEELLELIVQSAVDTMEAKASCLWLMDEEKNEFYPAAHSGLSEKYFQSGPIHIEKIAAAIQENGYLFARDASTDSRLELHDAKKAEGIASLLNVPVMVKGRLIGALSLYTSQPRDFSKDEIEFLTALAEQGGMAIEHARLVDKIRANTKLFHDLAANLNASLDIKEILRILSADIAEVLKVKAVSILLIDEDKQTLELAAGHGLSERYLSRGPLRVEKSIKDTLEGKPVFIRDATTDGRVQYHDSKREEGIVSILSVPIMAKEKSIGVLRLYTGTARDFTEDEIGLVTALAHQGGLAIQNASLYLMLKQDMKEFKEDLWSHRSWF
jgi:GAF domain-containing protein